jgi:hypothetical protein
MEQSMNSFKKSVFISHSGKNFSVADELRSALETRGVCCWIAPRDVPPGYQYGAAIVEAIRECSIVVLLLTEDSNQSKPVENEIECAFRNQKVIVPIRLRNVKPSTGLEFFISNAQWVDAFVTPLKTRVEQIINIVHALEMNQPIPEPEPEKRTLLGTVELFLERTLRHKILASVAGFLILVMLAVAGLYMQSSTKWDLSSIDAKLGKVKLETSADPRKELANRGVVWDPMNFSQAIRQNDVKTINLFIAGGMPIRSIDAAQALKSDNAQIIGLMIDHPNLYDADSCRSSILPDLQHSTIDQLQALSSNQKGLIKSLCSSDSAKKIAREEYQNEIHSNQKDADYYNEKLAKIKSVPDCIRLELKNNGQDLVNEGANFRQPLTIRLRDSMLNHIKMDIAMFGHVNNSQLVEYVKDYCAVGVKAGVPGLNIAPPADNKEATKKWELILTLIGLDK